MAKLTTRDGHTFDDRALSFEFSRSGGPGGQHVNTSSTKVRVVLELSRAGFDAESEQLLRDRLGATPSASSSSQRSQLANRKQAVQRLLGDIDRTLVSVKERRPTRPSRAAVERRLDDKKRASEQKRSRQERDW